MTNSKPSSINILVALEKAALQQVIDTQLPVDLLSQFTPDGASDLKISVRLNGKVDFQVERNTFKYKVPLQLFVEKDTMLGDVDVLFEMYLDFETKFLFKEDWELVTRTQLSGYEWITKPEIDLGLFNIPVDNAVLNALMENKLTICDQVDAKLKEMVNVRLILDKLIATVPNPIITPNDAKIWWVAEPFKTAMTPLDEKKGVVFGKVGLHGGTQFAYGRALKKIPPIINAPDIVNDLEEESLLQTHLLIDFSSVEKTAIALLQKQAFEFKGQKIKATRVKISKSGQRLKVAADLEGSFTGSMAILGQPVFDSAQQLIALENVDLDLKGKNFLSKTLVVFLKNIIEEQMKPFLKIPLKNNIEWLNETIKHQSFDFGLFAKAKVNKVDIPTIDIQDDALVLDLSLRGNLELGLKSQIPST